MTTDQTLGRLCPRPTAHDDRKAVRAQSALKHLPADTRLSGTIRNYFPARGWGFICVDGEIGEGALRDGLFCHVTDFVASHAPYIGLRVSFELGRDIAGRTKAVKIAAEAHGTKQGPLIPKKLQIPSNRETGPPCVAGTGSE